LIEERDMLGEEIQASPAPRRGRHFERTASGVEIAPPPGQSPPVVQPSPPLMRGRHLTCPGCEKQQDVLDFIPFDYSEKYADQVVAVHRCPSCGHIFALDPNPGGSDA
jgi:hypothetical protein